MPTTYTIFWCFFAFLFGAVLGSFVNVLIYRLPRDESIVWPGSRCPACAHPIRSRDNIPILGYLLLGGKCRDCGSSISPRYPVMELITACLSAALFLRFGLTPGWAVFLVFTGMLLAACCIDLDLMIIPDAISLNGIPIGIVAALAGFIPGLDWTHSLLGTFLGGLVLYIPAVVYEKLRGIEGLGGGDIKLLAMIGAFLGPAGVVFVMGVSSLVGSVVGLADVFLKRADSTTPVPFGPFLSGAAVLYLFVGPELVEYFFGFSPYHLVKSVNLFLP
ncbi:MAG: prepilin peptidase [Pseudomonadota bacterium]